MPKTTKRETAPIRPQPGKTAVDKARDEEAVSKREAREDAAASRQDRPGTSLPAQRQRWEDEGGSPAGVIASTDAVEPKKSED